MNDARPVPPPDARLIAGIQLWTARRLDGFIDLNGRTHPAGGPPARSTGHLNSSGFLTDTPAVNPPTEPVPVNAPDRVSVWPMEGGRFGIDATYHGATGYQRAEAHRAALERARLRVSLRQELGDSWTLRLGPLARDAAWLAIESFIGPRG